MSRLSYFKTILSCSFYGAFLACLALNSFFWWLLTDISLSLPGGGDDQHRRMIPQTDYYDNHKEATQFKIQQRKTQLPEWITSYLQWHNETRQQLNEDNWQDYKYLVSSCYHDDVQCGGLADRLRTLPFLVQVAAMTGRILLFSWERPYVLTEFLQPTGSIDWRLPSYVRVSRDDTHNPSSFVFNRVDHVERIRESLDTVVSVHFQAYKEAEKYFDRYKVKPDDADMTQVLPLLWKLFFQPTPPIQQQIDSFYQRNHLTVSNYLAVHLRVLYDSASDTENLVESVRNALTCASQFSSFSSVGMPIVVASDSQRVTDIAQQLAPSHVVTTAAAALGNYSGPTIHLDRGSRFLEKPGALVIKESSFPVEAYYATFVDFYILMGAKCVAFDRGGFGRFASLLSADPTCRSDHRHHKC